jgi:predicted nucleic-acid-binding Zn-ribbon protein
MHYVKKIEQDKTDVRSNTFIIYKCNVCGHDEWFRSVPNFDKARLRACPKCGTVDDTNDKEYLLRRKAELTEQINKLNGELITVTSKLEVLEIEEAPMPSEGVVNGNKKETSN